MTPSRPLSDLIDAAVEEAPQAICAAGQDAPIERLDELLAALQGPAVRDTLAMRVEQIVKYGHDAARDAKKPPAELPRLAMQFGIEACQLIEAGPERRDLAAARRKLVRLTAAGLAAIDRIDVEIGKEQADGVGG